MGNYLLENKFVFFYNLSQTAVSILFLVFGFERDY